MPTEDDHLSRLSDMQKEFLRDARQRAKAASDAAFPAVAQRFEELGFAHDALARVLQYIRERAPIVIHFNPERAFGLGSTVLEAFLTDTHYRNQFETNVSAGALGGSRDSWERWLFAGHYHRGGGTVPFERLKYGALNLYQPPPGKRRSRQWSLSIRALPGRPKTCDFHLGRFFGLLH